MRNRETRRQTPALHALALSAVLLAGTLLQLPSVDYFFQGDSLYWLAHRYRDWSEVGQALVSLDLHGWYRPLSHRLIPSLLFPVFGMNPWPYHLPVFGLFLILCLLAHQVFSSLARASPAALLATSYFALHSYQVFVTFDFFSEPDLLYSLFGLLTILSFLRWRRSGNSRRLMASGAWFSLALLSKEPAVMLPFVLAWMFLLEARRGTPRNLRSSGLWLHGMILAGYSLFVLAWMRGGTLGSGTLSLSMSAGSILENLIRLGAWSLNLPWSWHSRARQLPAAGWLALTLVGILLVLQWVLILLRKHESRTALAAAGGWFLISAAPLLLLLELKPYYLLFPLLGFSLAAGIGLDQLGRSIAGPRLRVGALALILVVLAATGAVLSDQDRRRHPLLGGSARLNLQARLDVLESRPELPGNAHLLILDSPGSPALWSFAGGELFRLTYRNPRLPVGFASLGFDWPDPAIPADSLVVFQLDGGRLRDVSEDFRADPARFLPSPASFRYGPFEPGLIQVEPGRVKAGRDSYRLTVRGLPDTAVEVQVRLDEGPIGIVRADLDGAAGVTYFVSGQTPRGRYTFLAVRQIGAELWRPSSGAVVVE